MLVPSMATGTPAHGQPQRLYLLVGMLCFWVLAIACRLVQLQVVDYGEFAQRAQRQQQRTIEVAPKRGVIYDRNGQELAMSVRVDSVFAVPSEIPDQATAATLLADVLGTDSEEILTRLKSSRAFCWIARKLDAPTADRIRALNLRGIYFQKESKRFYPNRELAAQALGYVGLDDEGLGGIERAYEAKLRGAPGKMLISLDARRRWFGRVEREPEPGQSLVLTLDEKIQYIAERELEAAMQQTHAESGTVIVQNPHTGEILALASRPTFNPNTFQKAAPQALKNRAVSDVYEPGSTFKIVTLAAALEEKLARPDELIDCQMGSITVSGVRIRDHKPFGMLTVPQILIYSSDVGAIKMGLRLGEERFDRYIRAFGFGSQTGVELPGETRGLARPVNRWSKVSIGAISMGQEIGITPVQLAAMVSTIANDGVRMPPRVVVDVTAPGTPLQNVSFHPADGRRVISPLTALEMKKAMQRVVLEGTGRRAILDGYTVGGKTGTAQKIDPATRSYSHWKHVATFAGFAPVNNPAVTVVVVLDSPVGPHEGGQVSAPVFQRVTQQVLAYLNVPHDVEPRSVRNRELMQAAAKVGDAEIAEGSPDRLGWDLPQAESQPAPETQVATTPMPAAAPAAAQAPGRSNDANAQLLPAAVRTAQVVPPAPAPPPLQAPAAPPANGTVVLDTEGGVVVPSLIGKPLREAIELAQESGIELEVIG
ncbi:MAG: penicillin-binding transpeptidase domain-containing protein, partial [Acidobacteriota bacterium]|nr:penicillin-binding transpeptidase domain-containing protein [Acidobacteriota bacterium]